MHFQPVLAVLEVLAHLLHPFHLGGLVVLLLREMVYQYRWILNTSSH
nr:MAG TPA: hypothetical protein [Bacteriophage sp.]